MLVFSDKDGHNFFLVLIFLVVLTLRHERDKYVSIYDVMVGKD